MKIAAAYIRVSTEDQIEFSPDSQIARIRDYAKRNGYILPNEYIFMDEGISGRKAEKRPAFMKMIGTAKTKPKPFEAILLWKFSRFARNREDSIVYKSMLRKQYGIDVISISENLGDDKMSILIEALIEAMDEFYSINLSEEVIRGMSEKAKRGGVLSVPAFGYTVSDGKYVIVPEEAEIIKKVFTDYCNGSGMLRIAKDLNAMGVKTHRGSKIENRTVEYWLNNPIYNGKIRWTPTGKSSRNYHNPDSIIADGTHEPIIDDILWQDAQERMAEQKAKYRPYYKPHDKISHWLVGLVHCSACNGPFVNCAGYLMCNNKNKGTCSGTGSIKADKLAGVILSNLKYIADNANASGIAIRQKAPDAKTINDAEIYKSQLQRAKSKLSRIKEAYEDGIDTLEEYKVNKTKITAEIKDIEKSINAIKPNQTYKQLYARLRDNINTSLPMLTNPKTTAVEKHDIAAELIADIVKDGTNINIVYFA